MKKYLFPLIALFMGLSFTACEGEGNNINDDIDQKASKNEIFLVEYICQPSAEWFTYYDITATYTDIHGQEHTLVLSPTQGLEYKGSDDAASKKLAKHFTCIVKAVAKQGLTVDPELKVDLKQTTSTLIASKPADGQYSLYYLNQGIDKLGMADLTGTVISKYLERNQEGYFINLDIDL